MKKTFKRAGVAVLSMAMLLSMGAATALTGSAVDGETPAKVKTVTVANMLNDDGTTTDTGAKVGIYQVATRNADGSWSWLNSVAPTVAVSGVQKPVVFGTADANQISISSLTADQVHELAIYLQTHKTTFTNKSENNSTGTAINLFSNDDGQPVGYYLIVTEPGSSNTKEVQPTLASYELDSTGNANVTPKAAGITVDKSITGVTQSDGTTTIAEKNADSCMAEIGSTVSYQISTKTPAYATGVTPQKAFTIYDDPSDGIDIVKSSVNVTVGGTKVIENGAVKTGVTNITYTPVTSEGTTTDGFTIAFGTAYLAVAANQDQAVVVTFNATVGSDAVKGATEAVNSATNKGSSTIDKNTNIDTNTTRNGNPNSTYIEYSNNYTTGGGDGTGDDTVNTFVGKIVLGKYKNASERIAGSTFMLTKQDETDDTVWNNVTNAKISLGVVQPTASGDFDLGYLAPGTYKLTETVAPAGYKVVAPTTFTVSGTSSTAYDTVVFNITAGDANTTTSGTNGDKIIKVVDPEADKLPGTGGMGTTLFTVGGAAVVLLAGFLFVVYMRKRKVEE